MALQPGHRVSEDLDLVAYSLDEDFLSIISKIRDNGYVLDIRKQTSNILVATVNKVKVDIVNERVNTLSKTEKEIYLLLQEIPGCKQATIAAKLNFSEQYVRKVIKNLKDKQLIRRVGSDKTGHWEILE